ncbi:MAG TPA: hypothetical protein VEG35_05445 [Burkholderiales bacterium]|nr:hypothetical protein [Burkholderiales bacterium]
MKGWKDASAVALGFVLLLGTAFREALSAPAEDGLRVGVQADLQMLFPPASESAPSNNFSPFLAFEIPLVRHLSVRVGLSPPLGSADGEQAYATNLALNLWFGRGPGYLEAAVGSYYQNTWCNGRPDYKYYTLYLGWRHMPGKTVLRIGAMLAMTPGGRLNTFGVSLGFGRSVLKVGRPKRNP